MIRTAQSFSVYFLYLNLNFRWNIYAKYGKEKKKPISKADKTTHKNLLK